MSGVYDSCPQVCVIVPDLEMLEIGNDDISVVAAQATAAAGFCGFRVVCSRPRSSSAWD